MSDEIIINAYKNFLFKFTPFLNTKKSIGSADILDDQTVQKYSALRGNFYGELLESLYGANPEIVKKVFSIINNAKYKYDKLKKDIEYIRENIGAEDIKDGAPAAAAPSPPPHRPPATTARAAATGNVMNAAGSVTATGALLDPPINIQIDFIKILLILALKQFGKNVCYATEIPSDDTIIHFRTDLTNIFDTVFTKDYDKYAKIPNDLYTKKLSVTFHNSTVADLFYLLKESLFGKTTVNAIQQKFLKENKFNQDELNNLLNNIKTLPELLSKFVKEFELSSKNTKGEYTTINGSSIHVCFNKEEKKAATEKMYNLLGYEKKLTFAEMTPNQLQLLIKNILIFAYKNSAGTVLGEATKSFNLLCYKLTTVNDIYKLNPFFDLSNYKAYITRTTNLKNLIDLIITDNRHTCYSKDLDIINSHNIGGFVMDYKLKTHITNFLKSNELDINTMRMSVSDICNNKIKELLFGNTPTPVKQQPSSHTDLLRTSSLTAFGGSPAAEEQPPAASAPPSEPPAEPPRKLTSEERADLTKKSLILKKLLYLATLYTTDKGKQIQRYQQKDLLALINNTGKLYEKMPEVDYYEIIKQKYDNILLHINTLETDKYFGKDTKIFQDTVAFDIKEINILNNMRTLKHTSIRTVLIEILKHLGQDAIGGDDTAINNEELAKLVGMTKKPAVTSPVRSTKPQIKKGGAGGAQPTEEEAKEHAEDPDTGPNIDKVDLRDRGIFVVLLFIIRALALFMTEWAVYSGYVNTFSQTFNMYFGVYLCIFILILILTNVKSEISFFQQAFYYVNADAENGKGTLRIILQLMCIIFILPIPYMVKDFRLKDTVKNRVLTYTEKSNIYYSVEKFSLYTWILTCVFALIV